MRHLFITLEAQGVTNTPSFTGCPTIVSAPIPKYVLNEFFENHGKHGRHGNK